MTSGLFARSVEASARPLGRLAFLLFYHSFLLGFWTAAFLVHVQRGRNEEDQKHESSGTGSHIQVSLQAEEIQAGLSGGSAVSFYCSNKSVPKDLSLINTKPVLRSRIKSVMDMPGFHEQGHYFLHPPKGPALSNSPVDLSVGEEPVKEVSEFELPAATLEALSLMDSVLFPLPHSLLLIQYPPTY